MITVGMILIMGGMLNMFCYHYVIGAIFIVVGAMIATAIEGKLYKTIAEMKKEIEALKGN